MKAMRALLVFDIASWPKDLKSLANYGRSQIQLLIDHYQQPIGLNGCDVTKIQPEWYKLKILVHSVYKGHRFGQVCKTLLTDEDHKVNFANVGHLIEILLTLPISTAGVERGFSTMKRIKSDHRASLGIETLDTLMRISIDGPGYHGFDAQAAMLTWKTERGVARKPHYKSWPTEEEYHVLRQKIAIKDDADDTDMEEDDEMD